MPEAEIILKSQVILMRSVHKQQDILLLLTLILTNLTYVEVTGRR